MVKQNLGKLDRIFRFVLGVWLIGPLAPHYAGSWAWLPYVLVFVGWIALAESFLGFCVLHDWFGINNRNQ